LTTDGQSATCDIEGCSYKISFFPTVGELPEHWDWLAVINASTFNQRPYLTALETTPPTNMNFGYLLFYKEEKPIGLCCLQTTIFQADDSINEKDPNASFLKKAGLAVKEKISGAVKIPVLIGGNILVTGENSYYFKEEEISHEAFLSLWKNGLSFGQEKMKELGIKTSGFFLKDFFKNNVPVVSSRLGAKFSELSAQPNMIFHVRPEWETFDDYLGAMSAKYRTRARRAKKKGIELERREMDEKLIEVFIERIDELYKIVANNAGFNLFYLHPEYFLQLKRELGDQYKMTGYFIGEELVAFSTLINSHDDLDAHFVGYDPKHNHRCQLYLNMLYDMVEEAINQKANDLIFARTAAEIKSSVGAVAYDMSFFLKHDIGLINRFAGQIYNYLEPPFEFVPRSPFKKVVNG